MLRVETTLDGRFDRHKIRAGERVVAYDDPARFDVARAFETFAESAVVD